MRDALKRGLAIGAFLGAVYLCAVAGGRFGVWLYLNGF